MRSIVPVLSGVVLLLLFACGDRQHYSGGPFGPLLSPMSGSGSAMPFATEPEAMDKENAHMRVRAYADRQAREMLAEWESAMFFYEDPPRLSMVGRRGRKGWTYTSPYGQSLKLDSDTTGKTGQTLAEWAPERAVYIVVRIVPLASKDELELVADDELIEMEEEVITVGEEQPPDDPQGDEHPAPDIQRQPSPPATGEDKTPAPARGQVATRNSSTGTEHGLTGAEGETPHGKGLKKQPGSEKGTSGQGSPDGHVHGLSRKHGGVKADGSITGVRFGAKHGGPGGRGKRSDDGVASGGGIEIFGLVLGGLINVPASLKPAVDVASILGQNLSAGGLFKRFAKLARLKKVADLRTEIAAAMRTDIDKELRASFASIDADKTLTAAEKAQLKRRTRHLAGRHYFNMLEDGTVAEIKRLDAEILKLSGKKDAISKHHRALFQEQRAAAENLQKAAKVKPVNGNLMRRHEHAGSAMPLPAHLHKKYGTHLPFTEDGFPDFSKFVRKEVKIKVQGNHGIDGRLADKAAGFTAGRPKGWSWHHHQDGTTMQLVPSDLHKKVGHHGSYSMYRAERGL